MINKNLRKKQSFDLLSKYGNSFILLAIINIFVSIRTLEYLMKHLSRVAALGEQTGMTARNVAIVWAPNLLRSKQLENGSGVAALHGVGIQAVVTEFLIRYTDYIFSPIPSVGAKLPPTKGSYTLIIEKQILS